MVFVMPIKWTICVLYTNENHACFWLMIVMKLITFSVSLHLLSNVKVPIIELTTDESQMPSKYCRWSWKTCLQMQHGYLSNYCHHCIQTCFNLIVQPYSNINFSPLKMIAQFLFVKNKLLIIFYLLRVFMIRHI